MLIANGDFEPDAKRSSLLNLRKVSDESLGSDESPVVRLQEAKIQTFCHELDKRK